MKNTSNVPYEVDFVTFKIVDKKVLKRTAIQEQVIFPLRAYNYATAVAGKKDERTVFTRRAEDGTRPSPWKARTS